MLNEQYAEIKRLVARQMDDIRRAREPRTPHRRSCKLRRVCCKDTCYKCPSYQYEPEEKQD